MNPVPVQLPAVLLLWLALSCRCRSDVRVARIAARVVSVDAVAISCVCSEFRVCIAGDVRTHRGDQREVGAG